MPLACFLAYRFLRGSQLSGSFAFMLKLCFLGMGVSTCALILVLAIAHGFENATYTTLKGVHADGIIRAKGKALDFEKINRIIQSEFNLSIRALSPSDTFSVMIQDSFGELGPVVYLKGIDPESVQLITPLAAMLIAQREKQRFQELFTENSVIIGAKISQQLGLSVGDTFTVLYPEEKKTDHLALGSWNVTVAGIVKTGIEEIDEQLVLCSLNLLQRIFPESSITEIGFAYTDSCNAGKTVDLLRKRFFSLEVYSWQDLYPPLVAALALEKYAITAIIILIMLIASMNIASLLLMYIHQKRKVFAVCKMMGLSERTLQSVIILMGTCIAASASLGGIVVAFLIGICLKHFPLISLPDAYYVTSLPVQLSPSFFIGAFCMSLIIGFCISLIPAYALKDLAISTTLREEE